MNTNMDTYTELIFALAENLAATLRRKPELDLRKLARGLYVQTFTVRTDRGYVSGTPSAVVDEQGFFGDLMATLPVI